MDIIPITKRFSVIADAVAALREMQKIPHEEFVSDYFLHAAAERSFQVAIQAALDIGSILLSARSHTVPETYSDIFPALAEMGVLPTELALQLVNMAKFRNVLVHMYLEVDLDLLYRYLQQNLADLELFVRHVGDYLQSAGYV